MSILRSLVGIAAELFTLNDPYEKHIQTTTEYAGRDHNGYSVYKIHAANYADAASLTDGYTVEGPVYKSLNHIGRNQWELRVECNDVRT